MNPRLYSLSVLALGLASLCASNAMAQNFQSPVGPGAEGIPAGGSYVPAGTLYDNEQTDGSTSLASQESDGTFQARSADDFIITAACPSGMFNITRIRTQMTSQNAAPQAFAVDLFNDDGTGMAPVSGITPFATVAQTTQMLLGPFGATTSLFEADHIPAAPLMLNANTTYWISGYGVDGAANAAGFNAFFGASPGFAGTTANGSIIAPGAGFADWTPIGTAIGPPELAFSFAIDGECVISDADISIAKTAAAPTPLIVGSTVTYTLAASNAGPGDADAVVVTDTLPANLTYVSNTCAATVAGQLFTWNIGTLANGANAACDIVTTVNTFGPIDNTANIASTTNDPTPGNNASTSSLAGVPFPADVSIALSSDAPAGSLGVGSQFNYTVGGSNAGPGVANDLAFALQLSNKVSFVGSSCGAVAAGSAVTWTVATLGIGATTSCVITVAVVASGDILATASVTTSTVDPSLVNNSADLVVGFSATQVPMLGQLGMLLLGLILAGAAVVVIRR